VVALEQLGVRALRAELDEQLGREAAELLMPPAPSARGQGSNDWVVSGS
jgi:hypothetical protein